METLISLFSTGGLGAVVGVVGGWLTKREERKKQTLDNAFKLKSRVYDLEELKLEQAQQTRMAEHQLDLAETEGAIEIDSKVVDAFKLSQQDGGHWMDVAKSLMRPLITIYLLGAATYCLQKIWALVGGLEAIPQDELMEIFKYIVYQIIFLCVTAVTWWFAARPSSQRPLGLK